MIYIHTCPASTRPISPYPQIHPHCNAVAVLDHSFIPGRPFPTRPSAHRPVGRAAAMDGSGCAPARCASARPWTTRRVRAVAAASAAVRPRGLQPVRPARGRGGRHKRRKLRARRLRLASPFHRAAQCGLVERTSSGPCCCFVLSDHGDGRAPRSGSVRAEQEATAAAPKQLTAYSSFPPCLHRPVRACAVTACRGAGCAKIGIHCPSPPYSTRPPLHSTDAVIAGSVDRIGPPIRHRSSLAS